MRIIKLEDNDIEKLKEFEIDLHLNESKIYFYDNNQLLKIFKSSIEEYITNKMFIINRLFYLKKYIDTDNFIMPNNIVRFHGFNSGYTMDFIDDSDNLKIIMDSNKISLEDKVCLLKQMAYILLETENNKVLKDINFHLSDIHEGNFIYDNKDKKVKCVDMDSSYLKGSLTSNSKYLTYNYKLWDYEKKYPLIEKGIEKGNITPNINTTILSFYYMFLNLLTNKDSYNFSKIKTYNLINNMKNIGFSKYLTDALELIYTNKVNYIDEDIINSITPKLILKYKIQN